MASERRLKKLNKLIRNELAAIINKELSFAEGVLVTVTRVETHRNLSQAEIFVTALPDAALNKALEILNNSVFELQQLLNRRLKMRPVPKIVFKTDKGQLKAEEVYRLITKNHKK